MDQLQQYPEGALRAPSLTFKAEKSSTYLALSSTTPSFTSLLTPAYPLAFLILIILLHRTHPHPHPVSLCCAFLRCHFRA